MSNPTDDPKMVPHIKASWISALRGGHYAQGRGQLQSGDCFCCLGVLADICPSLETDGIHYINETAGEQIGLQFESQDQLACMNDEGLPFEQIADWIEKNL